jgi:hypothetical protein
MNAISQMVVTTVLATTAVVMLTGGSNTPRPTSPPTTLRIESLSPNEVRVKVASSPWVPDSSRVPLGVWLDSATSPEPQPQLLIRTPAVVRVADLVIALDVTVLGAGAVLLYIKEGTSPDEQRVAWGRDITLERGDNGHFHPIWKIHSLP